MRPGDFSPGNTLWPPKRRYRHEEIASMRPGDFSPGNSICRKVLVETVEP